MEDLSEVPNQAHTSVTSGHLQEMKGRSIIVVLFLFLALLVVAARAGNFLIVNHPRPSDVILVLAGETNRRPARALQLLSQGYGRRIVLDVPTNETIFQFTETQLAEEYIQNLPQGSSISICPIAGLSTKDESKEAANCLRHEGAKSVLIVTSDFHTRRALSVFRREDPEYSYSTAAAADAQQFGERWWTHRQWSKIFFDEWMRLIWWKCVDQWH